MSDEIRILKERADAARILYKRNMIDRDEVFFEIYPYIVAYNERSKEIAKQFNIRPKQIHFASFLR